MEAGLPRDCVYRQLLRHTPGTQAFPRHPGTINTNWELHCAEYFFYCPQAGGGGRSWVSVT